MPTSYSVEFSEDFEELTAEEAEALFPAFHPVPNDTGTPRYFLSDGDQPVLFCAHRLHGGMGATDFYFFTRKRGYVWTWEAVSRKGGKLTAIVKLPPLCIGSLRSGILQPRQ